MNASIFFSWPEISIIRLIGADVHDPAAEDLHQGLDLGSEARRRVDLDQHQVALDVILARDVVDLHDRDDLLELLAHLIQVPVVAHDDDRDPREIRVLGLPDRQAIDIESPRGEHPRDVRQHAGLVLHQRRQQVTPTPRIRLDRHDSPLPSIVHAVSRHPASGRNFPMRVMKILRYELGCPPGRAERARTQAISQGWRTRGILDPPHHLIHPSRIMDDSAGTHRRRPGQGILPENLPTDPAGWPVRPWA